MVWQSRYRLHHPRSFRVWGGRPLLLTVAVIALGVMVVQVLSQINYTHPVIVFIG